MKRKALNIALPILLLMAQHGISAQVDANALVGIHNVNDTEMSAIANPITGSLVYNTTQGSVMQYNGTSWDKLLEGNSLFRPMVFAKTADYTVVSADGGNVLTFNSSSDVTLTIPSGLPIGFNISVYQIGDGKVSIVGASGVTILNRLSRFKTAGKDAGAGLICTATNIFHLTGDLKL
ncbi:MAG: hypothetical protein AB3N16_02465 [Flavobacteriaceae bacterium]